VLCGPGAPVLRCGGGGLRRSAGCGCEVQGGAGSVREWCRSLEVRNPRPGTLVSFAALLSDVHEGLVRRSRREGVHSREFVGDLALLVS
jgi:hypothetical protein